ncbi:MAG: carbon-monoxide dehydrogenase (Acceptor) [Actinomycetia bacterium]|nr:carbon-monoxide dehydrogenase (Acceptor) [Actinomycetes bacterium]
MKPAPFEYVRATQLGDALAALASDDDAKVIAGGQSLVPLMALRLARPALLVDVNDLPLDTVEVANNEVRLGSLVRHVRLERDAVVVRAAPLLAEAAALIGYPAIRNRGTLGGSVAHADPAAELPAALVALDGVVLAEGREGTRRISARDFFEGFLTTVLAPDELVVGVQVPVAAERHGASFREWAPRAGDFAVAGVAVVIELDAGGVCVSLGAAACGVGSTPVDLHEVLTDAGVLGASDVGDSLLRSTAQAAARTARGDDDREQLVGLLTAAALHDAFARARGGDASGTGVAA